VSSKWWNRRFAVESEGGDVLFRSFVDTGGALGAPKKIDLIGPEIPAEGPMAQFGGGGGP
jgi:hypothetical protein